MTDFPVLGADDIEVKVKQVTAKGAVCLLYKTARTDMNMLDKVIGPTNWRNSYQEIKNNLYCVIEIWDDEKKQWVAKMDCGIESREDGEGNEKKGEASDAFKRAGFRWGIGRELYTAPFTFLSLPTSKKDRGGYELDDPYARFDVSHIAYDESRSISELVIVNQKTKEVVYTMGKPNSTKVQPLKPVVKPKENVTVSAVAPDKLAKRKKELNDKAAEFKWDKQVANTRYLEACKGAGCTSTMLTVLTDTQFNAVLSIMSDIGNGEKNGNT